METSAIERDPSARIAERVTAWSPTMEEYHHGEGISAGFARSVETHGYGPALWRKAESLDMFTDNSAMAMGHLLHCSLQRLPPELAIAPHGMKGVTSRE